jgi:hypothetical protein
MIKHLAEDVNDGGESMYWYCHLRLLLMLRGSMKIFVRGFGITTVSMSVHAGGVSWVEMLAQKPVILGGRGCRPHPFCARRGKAVYRVYMSNGGMLRYYDDGDECQPIVRSFPFFRSIGMLLLLFNANPRSVTPPEFGIFSPSSSYTTSPDNISRTAPSNI